MSTIVAYVRSDGGPVDQELVAGLAAIPAVGAPDGVRTWSNAHAALGFGLLATGVPGERAQPVSLDREIWITADVRLDDRAALVATLQGHGRDVSTATGDAALILHAYMIWGAACVEHFSGDFAFALWDSIRQTLVFACDPLGIIPLYYVRNTTGIIVSNSMTSLRTLSSVSDTIDEATLVDYLLCGHAIDMDATFYRDIRRLPPAHVFVWSAGSEPQIRRYWELPEFDEYLRLPKPADYVEQFGELLRTAVRDRLPADRAAFTLTGGLDSGSVVALSADICRKEGRSTALHAYSIGYDWLIPDTECHYAFQTAHATGVHSEYLSVEHHLGYNEQDDGGVGWCTLPEPRILPSRPTCFTKLYQRACETGTRVLLSGFGGDALLEAEPMKWRHRVRSGRMVSDFRGLMRYKSQYNRMPLGLLRSLLLPKRHTIPYQLPTVDLLAPALAQSSLIRDRMDRLQLVRQRYRSGRHRLLYDGFWSDAMSLAEPEFTGVPLRVRHPFLDTRLLAFACSIAPMPWLGDKYILREAMRGLLPELVRRRRKTFLSGNSTLALVNRGLYQGADTLLQSSRIATFIDGTRVQQHLGEVQRTMSPVILFQLEYILTVCHWLETCSARRYHLLPSQEDRPAHVA